MNHPEKVSVAGSGMKNRYKTIIPSGYIDVSVCLKWILYLYVIEE